MQKLLSAPATLAPPARHTLRDTQIETVDKGLFFVLVALLSFQMYGVPSLTFLFLGDRTWEIIWMTDAMRLTAAVALFVIVIRIHRVPRLSPIPLVALALLVGRFSVDFAHNTRVPPDLNLYVQAATIFVAVWLLAPKMQWFLSFAVAGLGLAVLVLLWALFDPATAFWVTPGDTQGLDLLLVSRALRGPFPNPNGLGIAMALSTPFVFVAQSKAGRATMLIPMVLTTLLSGSRTSLIAVVATLVVAAVISRPRFSRHLRALLAVGAIGSAAAATIVVPFLLSGTGAFSSRGGVWAEAFKAWREFPVAGAGQYWKPAKVASAHNLLLNMLAKGGLLWVVPAVLVIVVLAIYAYNQALLGRIFPALYLVALLVTVIAEAPGASIPGDPWFGLTGFAIAAILSTMNATRARCRKLKTAGSLPPD